MSDVKWIKIVTDIFDDEKIRYIETLPNGDETIVLWFRILCLAGKSNSSGLLMITEKIAYTDEMLSSVFNRDIKSVQLALNIFQNLDMIEIIDNKIYLTNWQKYQTLEKLEQKKEYDRNYQKNRRNQLMVCNSSKESYDNRTSIVEEKNDNRSLDIDKDLDLELEEKSSNSSNSAQVIFQQVEQEFKRPLSSNEIDKISYWVDLKGERYFYHALREASMYGKLSVAYIDKIMLNWDKIGYTVDQLDEGVQALDSAYMKG